jgi:hypothetical protein
MVLVFFVLLRLIVSPYNLLFSLGWGDCIDLIKGRRIGNQFVPIIKMVQYFLGVKCVKGAMLVGDCVASSMAIID